jgi:hypothetical protein
MVPVENGYVNVFNRFLETIIYENVKLAVNRFKSLGLKNSTE